MVKGSSLPLMVGHPGLADTIQAGGTLPADILDHTAQPFPLTEVASQQPGTGAGTDAASSVTVAVSTGSDHIKEVDVPWQEILCSMVAELGYAESSRMMAVEELVLSKAVLKRAPQVFSKYLPKLLPLASQPLHESMKRTAGDDDVEMTEASGGDQDSTAKRRKVADDEAVNSVLNHASRTEISAMVDDFIATKREQINESNRNEFIKKSSSKSGTDKNEDEDDDGCARVDARKLNRTIQMKQEVVKNEALAKTNPKGHAMDNSASQLSNSALDERLNNIQEHLNVRLAANPPCTLTERVKVLEDVIMQLERDYPPWAALHFNQPNRTFPPPPAVTTVTRGYMNQLVMTGDHLLSPSTMTGDIPISGVDMARTPSAGLDGRGMSTATSATTSGVMTPGGGMSAVQSLGLSGPGGAVGTPTGSGSTGSATVIKLKRHGGGSSSLQRAVQEQLAQRQAMAAMGLTAPKPYVHPLNDPNARSMSSSNKGNANNSVTTNHHGSTNINSSTSPMMPPFEDLSKPGVTGRGPIKSRRKSIAKGLDPASAMAAMGVVGSPVLSAVNSGLSGVTSTTALSGAASKPTAGGAGDNPKKPRKKRTASISGPGGGAGQHDNNGSAKSSTTTKPPRTGLGKGKMGGASAAAHTTGRGLGKGKMGGGLGKGKGGAYLQKHFNQVSEDEDEEDEEDEDEEEEEFVKPTTSRSSGGKAGGRSTSSKAKKAKGRSAMPVRKFGGKSFGMVGGESSGSSSNESSDDDGDGSGSSGSQSDSSSSSSLESGSDIGDSD
ncbi:hypothetical protein BGW41_002211 [Actinomortierella wolfii]|nr:hypothetical protein BGW41_002211 [Actinomortierella wolfii]